ncbi:caspase, EACC1-associated type [Streptomyces sp. AK02-01A]|uniref:caspase, EACC1-associated type n=1 Tax=Streptomyces sp. AK02-01A TaxID=3028648 RepID=UPI0029BBFB8E|nr:caspase family protein [Streptomyces sp. AK02-01A]MDX3851765.1 caspase family protein [Streptomyces sp. AK02-01A]
MILPDPHRSRAVLIGVSDYAAMPGLPSVRNNVDAVRHVLTGAASWNLPAEHCAVVHNPRTTEELVDPVLEAAEEATDTLLVYYAGHGVKGPNRGELRLTRSASRPGAPHTATHYDDIRDILLGSSASRRIIILDCCYAGSALGTMADPGAEIAEDALIEGTYLIAAAGETQKAMSEDGAGFTAFTGELVRLLRHGIPDTGKMVLDLDTVFTHLDRALRAKSLPRPHRRVRNSPGGLTLAWNRRWLEEQHATVFDGAPDTAAEDSERAIVAAAAQRSRVSTRGSVNSAVATWPTSGNGSGNRSAGEAEPARPAIWPAVAQPSAPVSPTPAPVLPKPAPAAAPPRRPGAWPAGIKRPGGDSSPDSTARVRRMWPEILEAVKNRRRFAWILLSQNARMVDRDDTTLRIAFSSLASHNTFVSSGCEDVLRQALVDLFHTEYKIEASFDAAGTDRAESGGSAERPSPPPPPPPPLAVAEAKTALDSGKKAQRSTDTALAVGDRISHESFGQGIVVSVTGSGQDTQATISFGENKPKRFLLRYAPIVKI